MHEYNHLIQKNNYKYKERVHLLYAWVQALKREYNYLQYINVRLQLMQEYS